VGASDRKESGVKAAHPNSRFHAPASNARRSIPAWKIPAGKFPIDAIILAQRRPTPCHWVTKAFNWSAGVYMGADRGSEMTASGPPARIGAVRRDPMAMLPFCAVTTMGDYFRHWIRMRAVVRKHRGFSTSTAFRSGKGISCGRGSGKTCDGSQMARRSTHGRALGKENRSVGCPFTKTIELERPDFSTQLHSALQTVDRAAWRTEVLWMKNVFIGTLHGRLHREPLRAFELLDLPFVRFVDCNGFCTPRVLYKLLGQRRLSSDEPVPNSVDGTRSVTMLGAGNFSKCGCWSTVTNRGNFGDK